MLGRHHHELGAGDRLEFDKPSDVVFRNDGKEACRYVVVVVRR